MLRSHLWEKSKPLSGSNETTSDNNNTAPCHQNVFHSASSEFPIGDSHRENSWPGYSGIHPRFVFSAIRWDSEAVSRAGNWVGQKGN